jgi:hypothetical protein
VKFFPGCWDSFWIDFWIPASDEGLFDLEVLLSTVQAFACSIFLGRYFSTYNRSKWTGADLAINDLGIMECVHNLLTSTFRRYYNSFMPSAPHQANVAYGNLLAIGDALHRNLGRDGADDPVGVAPRSNATEPDEDGGKEDFGEAKQAKFRVKAHHWMLTKPKDKLALMRVGVEPLRLLLNAQFDLGSEEWEVRQQAHIARGMRQGIEHQRQYRPQIAAWGDLEHSCFERIGLAFNEPSLWEHVSDVNCTFRMRCLSFRLLSRVGCAVEWYQAQPHREFPTLMFGLVDQDDTPFGEQLRMRICICEDLWDSWTRDLVQRHPTLKGKHFQADLKGYAARTHIDNASTETGNARLRRFVWKRVQCKKMNLEDLGVLWMASQASRTCGPTVRKTMRKKAIACVCSFFDAYMYDHVSLARPRVCRRRQEVAQMYVCLLSCVDVIRPECERRVL